MGTQGSVEVRCFPNSIDPELIDTWARWLVTMRDSARNLDISAAMETWYSRPSRVLDGVFGYGMRATLEREAHPQTPGQLIQFGVENAHEIWCAFQPMLEDTPETEEPEVTGEETAVMDPDGGPRGIFDAPPGVPVTNRPFALRPERDWSV
jgi:hypothetical protein